MSCDFENRSYRVLMLGDSKVGKSSIMRRFVEDDFDFNFSSTIGIDYKRTTVTMQDGCQVKLQIWDTAGQERFRGLAKHYYRGAHVAVVVYDVTDSSTLMNVPFWLNDIKNNSEEASDIIHVLVGNKVDCEGERKVEYGMGETLASSNDTEFFETSAFTGQNIKELYTRIAQLIHQRSSSQMKRRSGEGGDSQPIRVRREPAVDQSWDVVNLAEAAQTSSGVSSSSRKSKAGIKTQSQRTNTNKSGCC